MAQQVRLSQPAESFELVSFDNPEHAGSVALSNDYAIPWIDPNMLKLMHRIGRGEFGDVWLATHHVSTDDYDEYHEVAVKMLPSVKEDQPLLTKVGEIFQKSLGLEDVCFLHGVTIKNGNVCMVMKFYDGSVGDKLAHLKGGKLQISDVLQYGTSIAQAILSFHSRGLLVLNIKPCNILVNEHDQAILGDIGIPFLLYRASLSNQHFVQRLGTPNYMAPEQWQPDIRGPISYETDTWGFGCSILEMLSGIQPWSDRSPAEIYHMVVEKQEKPKIPTDLPPPIEKLLCGCFEYDLRNRPLMEDVLYALNSCKNEMYGDISGVGHKANEGTAVDRSVLKDRLEVGDIVRSRKAKNSCMPESMEIPEGTVVGLENEDDAVLVRVHGVRGPQRIRSSALERVTHGFAAGDWVRLSVQDKKQSPVGILHSVSRDGRASAGFLGLETLWTGSHSQLQMANAFHVGQFVTLKANITKPRFEWPARYNKTNGSWVAGRISLILPNGCLVLRFPGRLVIGGAWDKHNLLADPAEVEVVSFSNREGVMQLYQHLEDFHWAVRPLVIAMGIFTALRIGVLVGTSVGMGRRKKIASSSAQTEKQQQDSGQNPNAAWLPSNVASMLFREGTAPATPR